MTLNPFCEQLESAEQKASELAAGLQKVRQEIEWFEGARLDTLLCQLDELRSEAEDHLGECDRISAEAEQIEQNIQAVSGSINTLWNPKNWFDSQQRGYRAQVAKLKDSLKKTKGRLSKSQGSLRDVLRREKEKTDEVENYRIFDFDAKNNERSNLARQLSEQKEQVQIISNRKQQVDTAIEPIISQIREVDRKKSEAVAAMQRAQMLDNELSDAQNSYDRAMVHRTCEDMFGTGSPRKVISKMEAEVRRLDRDCEKLKARARSVASKATRDVRQLILDGNNLCYEGDRFLGLDALRALVPALSECYDVTVVFDASIRRALQSGDAEVRGVFGGNVKIHVVATSVKADATVLDLAGSDKTAFVISNDRFAEFWEKPAVKDGRLIRHEIVAGRVLIHDLGISEAYRE